MQPRTHKKVTIIVPVYNERKNIQGLVERIHRTLVSKKISYNLIFVDDHSTDGSLDVITHLMADFPIQLYIKPAGIPKGKAFSLLYGGSQAETELVAMIDADLQYPPEALPDLIAAASTHGVVVADRVEYGGSGLRRTVSRAFNQIFGRSLHGFDCDVQSGLKVFHRRILDHIDSTTITPWTFDLTLLLTARNLGDSIGSAPIQFHQRAHGHSKVNLIKASWEIGVNAILLLFRTKQHYFIAPKNKTTMQGAGIIHRQQRLITHTTLSPRESALLTFSGWQLTALVAAAVAVGLGLVVNFQVTAISVMALLSLIYFIDVCFNAYVIIKSLYFPPEITYNHDALAAIDDAKLPVYTILSPLYKEAAVLPEFINAMDKLEWPKSKLEVLLLLEADDAETLAAVKQMNLPDYIRPIQVPDSLPKTKPKACNYGLGFAKGEYLVIYDAEDRPDPWQLKKAYLSFQQQPDEVVCLQAKLNYYNPRQNLLTRLFTAEYSLWFDVILSGLQTINTVIPLGGTSNHFKTSVLQHLQGWDPFNVTEDCDLGVRLFKHGNKTAVIDSTTWEEANSDPKNWIRQRSRWIKGYFQTFLVHNRHPLQLIKDHGIHAFIFQLIIGARMSFMLINPWLWIMTIAYFGFYQYTGAFIESLYPTVVFYMAVTSLLVGNFMYIFNYMIGVAKRRAWEMMKYVYLIPLYWLMASAASVVALYQLLVKPHYWEKTIHGLHQQPPAVSPETAVEPVPLWGRFTAAMRQLSVRYDIWVGGSLLIVATMLANVGNFFFNALLSRRLSFDAFGEFSLFSSLLSIAIIPLSALSVTISHSVAYLSGQKRFAAAAAHIRSLLNQNVWIFAGLTLIWLAAIPVMASFFNISSPLPFFLFTPIWMIGFLMYSMAGYLRGKLRFGLLAVITIADVAVKLGIAAALIAGNQTQFLVAVLPLTFIIQGVIGWWAFTRESPAETKPRSVVRFDTGFFIATLAASISSIMFVGFDILLAKHYLPAEQAGQYGMLSLVGKIVYFASSLLLQFLIPMVSRNEGSRRSSRQIFLAVFGSTGLIVAVSYLALGVLGWFSIPLLFGEKAVSILPYLPMYLLGMSLYVLTRPLTYFYQAKKQYAYAGLSFFICVLQAVMISVYHRDLTEFIRVMTAVSGVYLAGIGGVYLLTERMKYVLVNLRDGWLLLFGGLPTARPTEKKVTSVRVLIFNWRDITHRWAGGAETYVHECAKRWVRAGHRVTVFCGNDGHSLQEETIDGVEIVRRGGFFTVYVWAFLYYTFRFRGRFDVVIDSENGIPFFTPLYVGLPKFLLVHHIHQEVFRKHLPQPLAAIAAFLESTVMPAVYRRESIITVSESTKQAILNMQFREAVAIGIVNPGVEMHVSKSRWKKSDTPAFSYVGRLKPYKNLDVVIRAFKEIRQQYPTATLTIAGTGESLASLQTLTRELELEEAVVFTGRISETSKAQLLSTSWAMLQPSMVEGWGITVIEANAMGTPVIAANVNGLRDSVINLKTGLLVTPQNVHEFAVSMEMLIQNARLRRKLSKEAYRWSHHFSWDKSAHEFLAQISDKLVVEYNYSQFTRTATSSV